MDNKNNKPVKDSKLAEAISAPFKGTTTVLPVSQVKAAIKTQAEIPSGKLSGEQVLNKYLNLIDGPVVKLKQGIGGLVVTNTRISGLDPKSILSSLRAKEVANKHRLEIIEFIDEALRLKDGRPIGLSNEEFNEKKHMTPNRMFAPDMEWNKKRLDARDASMKKHESYLKAKKIKNQ